MGFRVVNGPEVKDILNMKTCIELIEFAHSNLAKGHAVQPLRDVIVPKEGKGILATMPAYIAGEKEAIGLKAVTVFPGNHEYGIDSHQGAIILFNPKNGLLQTVIDAAEITAMRTAAASAVATKYLARKDSSILSLIGAGVQAHSHLKALTEILDFESINIWNRTEEKSKQFVEQYSSNYPIESRSSISDVLSADVICTLTATKTPLFDIADVQHGTHINAVGASQPTTREIGSGFTKSASWFTDVYESVSNEAGELLIPLNNGEITELPPVTELGDVINNEHKRRKNHEEITVYKSLGVGIQDMVCAQYIHQYAEANEIGKLVEF